MDVDKAALRDVLVRRYPWLERPDVGPRAVVAGECDRCGEEARLVETCGPVPHHYLGRTCTSELGLDAWCDGHADEGRQILAWLESLPHEADDVARLWWVATGEVRVDPRLSATHARLGELLPSTDAPDGPASGSDRSG